MRDGLGRSFRGTHMNCYVCVIPASLREEAAGIPNRTVRVLSTIFSFSTGHKGCKEFKDTCSVDAEEGLYEQRKPSMLLCKGIR